VPRKKKEKKEGKKGGADQIGGLGAQTGGGGALSEVIIHGYKFQETVNGGRGGRMEFFLNRGLTIRRLRRREVRRFVWKR